MTTRMRMKGIWYGASFLYTDMQLYEMFRDDEGYPGDLKPGECYLFVAAGENQLIWFLHQQTDRDGEVTFTDTRRWRFPAGTKWEVEKLNQYAKQAGIELAGMRSFVGVAADFREEKRQRQREARKRFEERRRLEAMR